MLEASERSRLRMLQHLCFTLAGTASMHTEELVRFPAAPRSAASAAWTTRLAIAGLNAAIKRRMVESRQLERTFNTLLAAAVRRICVGCGQYLRQSLAGACSADACKRVRGPGQTANKNAANGDDLAPRKSCSCGPRQQVAHRVLGVWRCSTAVVCSVQVRAVLSAMWSAGTAICAMMK